MEETTDQWPDEGDDQFPDEVSDDASRKELEALLMGAGLPQNPQQGSVVSGRVVQIKHDGVFLDVGAKSEGLIDPAELVDADGNVEVKVGDIIEATVVSLRDGITLSRKMLKMAKLRADLEDALQSGVPVEGKVEGVRKGGFDISLAGGTRGFCPLSQIDERRVPAPEEWVGRALEFRVIEIGQRGRNVVVSRRRLLEEVSAKRAEETLSKLDVDAILEGTVASLKDYGAFVDIGGVQGLLHISEISHSRLRHPSEILTVGETISVKVLRLDRENNKISLGMRQLAADPWASIEGTLSVGDSVEGKVMRAAQFGAFVEVMPGVEGLLHVSELAPGKPNSDARTLVTSGEAIAVKILAIDVEKHRLSLARYDPSQTRTTPTVEVGAVLTGKVSRVEAYGVFVRFGPRATGLVANAEMGTARGTDHEADFPVGTEMEVEVMTIEEDGRRISLSRASAMRKRERAGAEGYMEDGGPEGDSFSTLGDAFRNIKQD